MPVDVVGDENKVNVQDLKIQPEQPSQKFSLDDISSERYEYLRNQVKTAELGIYRSLEIAPFLVLVGKMKRQEVPDYTRHIESSLSNISFLSPNYTPSECAQLLFQTAILYPEKLAEFLSKEDYYTEFARRAKSFNASTLQYSYGELEDFLDITKILGLIYITNTDWKGQTKESLEVVLNTFQGTMMNTRVAAVYRIAFPESNDWKKYFPESHWKFLKESFDPIFYNSGSGVYSAMALDRYIISADEVKVTNEGLVIIHNKKTEEKEELLPERRKY